jgi:hypothetical protein
MKVHQWLRGWDRVEFSPEHHRRKPRPYFYVFSLAAVDLRRLCGISRRQASQLTPRAADLGIQRQHDRERSEEIGQFVEFGYPWSTLSLKKRRSNEFNNFRKPGWLPTAIVVNILLLDDKRSDQSISPSDVLAITDEPGCHITLPYSDSKDWRPSSPVFPMEVIDGQHRLWAFDSESDPTFELPVVAFHGLDISWQAYLFWTINIKPKKINPSLAFDLYPLLRGEDWLEGGEDHSIYRETRSQEITEVLWSHPDSPWYDRINMLGERQLPGVSQSAWIRSLMATFVRPWRGRRSGPGGLFGSRLSDSEEVLGWNRGQQAAFLLFSWETLRSAICNTNSTWTKHLRTLSKQQTPRRGDDAAFYGPFTLIATDQGVRGYLHVLNDLCFVRAPHLDLRSWRTNAEASPTDAAHITEAIKSLRKHTV